MLAHAAPDVGADVLQVAVLFLVVVQMTAYVLLFFGVADPIQAFLTDGQHHLTQMQVTAGKA